MNALDALAGNPQRIALIGDLHGRASAAELALRWAAEHGADVAVQLGDFGYGWGEAFYPRTLRLTRELDLPLLWLPGNHENFDQLDADRAEWEVPDGEPWLASDWVAQLPNGYRLPWGDHGWLVIAGATSVDRPWRYEGTSWWPQEVQLTGPVADHLIAANAGDPVDVVISHDAFWTAPLGGDQRPEGILARYLSWHLPMAERFERAKVACTPQTLREADEHAKRVRRVVDQVLRPGGAFFHGHMHHRYSDRVDGWNVDGLAADSRRPEDGLCLLVDPQGTPIPTQ